MQTKDISTTEVKMKFNEVYEMNGDSRVTPILQAFFITK
jgi:hypothetical protein